MCIFFFLFVWICVCMHTLIIWHKREYINDSEFIHWTFLIILVSCIVGCLFT